MPRRDDAAEGDGWILTVVWRGNEARSDLAVFEATDIAKDPWRSPISAARCRRAFTATGGQALCDFAADVQGYREERRHEKPVMLTRRDTVRGGAAAGLGATLSMLAGRASEQRRPAFPSDPFLTVLRAGEHRERSAQLRISGELPRELRGTLYRNAPIRNSPRAGLPLVCRRWHDPRFHIDDAAPPTEPLGAHAKWQVEHDAGEALIGSFGNPRYTIRDFSPSGRLSPTPASFGMLNG